MTNYKIKLRKRNIIIKSELNHIIRFHYNETNIKRIEYKLSYFRRINVGLIYKTQISISLDSN